MKGVVSFKDDDDRFVVQAVHMLLEGEHQRAWRSTEGRVTRIVFIRRDLPRDTLRNGFMKCRAEQALVAAGSE
ncbi:GTP-binding protein [Mesorhizobium australicum]|uniref:GTP-binding protein n=1 Tax=Mesorhizobium australicum TaxID=536018 RepID=UPI000A1CF313|nr:GTP-binding protein [Mesorhizobium australicum]